MSSSWGKVFVMLGVVVGVMAFPQQSSSFPSSSSTLARQRRQVIDSKTLLCFLTGIAEGRDWSSCNSTSDEPSSPFSPTSSTSMARKRRQLGDSIDKNKLLCLLSASDQGRDGSSCNSSPDESRSQTPVPHIVPSIIPISQVPPLDSLRGRVAVSPQTDPEVAPAPSCRCVFLWQCKDRESQVTEGDSSLAFALDLRSSFGCDSPEETCCMDVDLSASPPTFPHVTPSCGESNSQSFRNSFRGFEDQQSQFGEFPWTAAIVSSRGFGSSNEPLFIGGGSLIHPQVVLTVAHNIVNKSYNSDHLKVRLGDWNVNEPTEVVLHQEIRVRRMLLHPNYHKVHQHYDVAILLLDRPAVLGATVNIICLPSPRQDYLNDKCVVSGWGKKRFDEKSRFEKVMKKVSLPLVDHAQCQAALQGTRLGPRFTLHDSFLCAGGQKEGQDTCTGDGGSPLVCRLQSDPQRYVQVGVVSWGIGCGQLGLPGVYTDVVKVQPWIDQVIGEEFGNAGNAEGLSLDLRNSFGK